MSRITEHIIEAFAIELLEGLGYRYIYAPDIAPFPSSGKVLKEQDDKFPSFGGVSEGQGGYKDIPGFCASVPIERVAELDYVLTPGRYVGLPEEEDDFDFAERFASLKAELDAQLEEEEKLNKLIAENLAKIKLKGDE